MKKYLYLKWTGISLLVLGVCLAVFTIIYQNRDNSKDEKQIESFDDAIKYINDHCDNLYLNIETPYWPKESFIVDLGTKGSDSTYIIYQNEKDTIKIGYKKYPKKNACKIFDVDVINNNNQIKKAIKLCQEIDIDPSYEKEINECKKISELDKELSRIYNILAGSHDGHVILGKDKDGKWKRFQLSDFPTQWVDEEAIVRFCKFHLAEDNKTKSFAECYKYYKFIQKDDIYIVYYDFRRDSVIEQNEIKKSHQADLSHPLNTIKMSKGWLNYKTTNPDGTKKWKLVSAHDYFMDPEKYFVPNDFDVDKAAWKQEEKDSKWFEIILYSISAVLIILSVVLIIYGVRNSNHQRTSEQIIDSKEGTGNEGNNDEALKGLEPDKRTGNSPEDDGGPKGKILTEEEIQRIKNDAIEAYKRENGIDRKIEYAKKWEELIQSKSVEEVCSKLDTISRTNWNKFPSSKSIKDQAVEKYKEEKDIDNQLRYADNWKKFVNLKSAKDVFESLDNIQKIYNDFPQLESLKSIYDEAVKSSSDFCKQMLFVIEKLAQQSKSPIDWEWRFNELCKNAEYAGNVRARFDAIASYVQEIEQKQEIMNVLAKDTHDYLDRMALTYWSIEGFNKLMGIFTTRNMNRVKETTIQEALLSDFVQLIMSRVFVKECSEDGRTVNKYV